MTPSHLRERIHAAQAAGFTDFAKVLAELYRKKFPSK